MAKSLLQQVMIKPAKNNTGIDLQGIVDKIESGYMVGKVDKYQKKKTFAPSGLSYGSGECPLYRPDTGLSDSVLTCQYSCPDSAIVLVHGCLLASGRPTRFVSATPCRFSQSARCPPSTGL